ncbi:MAG TPA: SDR family oxidoreductase [Candidatus Thermoplasmatota archaeon]|nr:SDR family oxidoreductase [Candidatus Thermoplasmatota archaeon]
MPPENPASQSTSTLAVTGATGHLGRLLVQDLLRRGVPAGRIVALARDPAKGGDLSAKGVQVRRADYEDGASLRDALRGVDRLLLVSATDVGQRARQHRNVLEAAQAAGVRHLAYTSILHADRAQTILAGEHRETEQAIRASGVPFTFLRNGWYLENYTGNLGPALQYGVLMGCADGGKVSAAMRAEFAEAAANVLSSPGHEGRVYELGGDEPFTMAELAAWVAEASGKPVQYQDMPEDAYRQALAGFGLPEPLARALADADRGLARGELVTSSGDLRKLLGRAPASPRHAVQAAVRARAASPTA